ncbi:MAG: hypothetical protein ACM3X0_07540 [Bacteroidota bacterium]
MGRNILRLAGSLLLAGMLGACGTVQMGAPQASIDNIKLARSSGMAAVAVGSFVPAPGKEASLEGTVTLRAVSLAAPHGSFADYLKETLAAELRGAGLLDPAAKLKIDGVLIERRVDAGIGQGTGALSARFIVRRDGVLRYDRELAVNAEWESPFLGAVAIPAAINGFTQLFRSLVARLLADPEFIAAVKPE